MTNGRAGMTTTLRQAGARVSMRPAPPSDPPFDDDEGPHLWSATATQPPLQLAGRKPPRHRPAAAQPTSPGVSASARAASAHFMKACLEILNGYRPVTHLRAMSSPLDAAGVLEAMTGATRRLAREVGAPTAGKGPRVSLQRMRVCIPRAGAAEISAVISAQPQPGRPGGSTRSWAAAFRLEHRQGRWQCTVARVL